MSSNQILGIGLLLVAALLVFLGYQASQSLGEQMHETLTGRFTDSTVWYFVLGVIAAVGGAWLISKR